MPLEISLSDPINTEEVLDLYRANQWSSAGRPNELLAPLRNWHRLVQPALQGQAIGLYKAPGFVRAGATGPMWLPAGHEH